MTGLGCFGADNIGTGSQRCWWMLFQRQIDAQQPTANCLKNIKEKMNFTQGRTEEGGTTSRQSERYSLLHFFILFIDFEIF